MTDFEVNLRPVPDLLRTSAAANLESGNRAMGSVSQNAI